MKIIKSVRPESDYEKQNRVDTQNARILFIIGLIIAVTYITVVLIKCS
jgi:hypothetical protein